MYNSIVMKKLVLSISMLIFAVILFAPGYAMAQDTADIFSKYTNPHAVCNFYRSSEANITTSNGQFLRPVIVRESDNECLTSLGTGSQKVYTQFYYSGNNWCWKMYQNGQTVYSNCVPKPNMTNRLTEFAGEFDQYFTEGNAPYIVMGFVVFVVILTATLAYKPPIKPSQSDTSGQEQVPSEKPPEYHAPRSVRSKTYKPKGKKKRILDDLINEKPHHKRKK